MRMQDDEVQKNKKLLKEKFDSYEAEKKQNSIDFSNFAIDPRKNRRKFEGTDRYRQRRYEREKVMMTARARMIASGDTKGITRRPPVGVMARQRAQRSLEAARAQVRPAGSSKTDDPSTIKAPVDDPEASKPTASQQEQSQMASTCSTPGPVNAVPARPPSQPRIARGEPVNIFMPSKRKRRP